MLFFVRLRLDPLEKRDEREAPRRKNIYHHNQDQIYLKQDEVAASEYLCFGFLN